MTKPEEDITSAEVLAVSIDSDDADTVGEYFGAALAALWDGDDSIGQKRVFGDSGWRYTILEGMVKADLVTGVFDADGYLDTVDQSAADRLLHKAFQAFGA